jgi:uncharacterized protein (DUF2062 family)
MSALRAASLTELAREPLGYRLAGAADSVADAGKVWIIPAADKADVEHRQLESSQWRRFARWMSPMRAWRELRACEPPQRSRCAAGVAVGAFIANLPVYGVQTLLCFVAARRLRLSPLPVLLGASLSTPPLGPVLIALAIGVGHWCLHGTMPKLSGFDVRTVGYLGLIRSVLLEWVIGSVVVGLASAVGSFVLVRLVLARLGHRPVCREPEPSAVDAAA